MLTVEEKYLPITLSVPEITDAQFAEICERYEHFRVEYTAEGEVLIMPPTDPSTSRQNLEIASQLHVWAARIPHGVATESSGGYVLPNGARYAPDAAWISRERFEKGMCPEFVIELLSPGDRRNRTHAKMLEWIENGAFLGWMIDPRDRTVTVYRPRQEFEVLSGVLEVRGEGPVAGFVLHLGAVWAAESQRRLSKNS